MSVHTHTQTHRNKEMSLSKYMVESWSPGGPLPSLGSSKEVFSLSELLPHHTSLFRMLQWAWSSLAPSALGQPAASLRWQMKIYTPRISISLPFVFLVFRTYPFKMPFLTSIIGLPSIACLVSYVCALFSEMQVLHLLSFSVRLPPSLETRPTSLLCSLMHARDCQIYQT